MHDTRGFRCLRQSSENMLKFEPIVTHANPSFWDNGAIKSISVTIECVLLKEK